jgi:hypothetical protein
MNTLTITLLLSFLVAGTNGFFQNAAKKTSSVKTSPLAKEAVEIFGAKYPYDRGPMKSNVFNDIAKFGVPKIDIDGSAVLTKSAKKTASRRITDLSESDVVENFSALASVYGEERSIGMVKIFPICLTFDTNQFSKTFAVWSEIYGDDATRGMVSRNPGLLAVEPKDATQSSEQTMVFSYIIALTRPIGIFGPIGILALLSVPGIEASTGIAITEPFKQALFVN